MTNIAKMDNVLTVSLITAQQLLVLSDMIVQMETASLQLRHAKPINNAERDIFVLKEDVWINALILDVDLENVLKVNAYPQLRKNIPAASQGQTN
jgi:hypothetical protein